jgi:hypothetical protein
VTVYEAVNVAHAASGRAGGFLARSWCDAGPARLLAQAGLWTRTEIFFIHPTAAYKFLILPLKGIVQPFELGGVTRLIQIAVKTGGPASFVKNERSIIPFSTA